MPHPALSIPTTAAAADPSRAGQARLKGPFAAYRRVRPGLPTADPPGGRCNQCRSRCSERNLNAMPLCDLRGGRAAVGYGGGIGGAGAGGTPVGGVGCGRSGIGGVLGGPALTSLSRRARSLSRRAITVVRGFINSCHCRGGGSIRGRPGWVEGTHGRAPAGSAGGFPPPPPPGAGDRPGSWRQGWRFRAIWRGGRAVVGYRGSYDHGGGGGVSARGVGCSPAPIGSVVYSMH